MTGCSLPHIALWVLTLPFRLIGWAVNLRPECAPPDFIEGAS